MHINDKVDVSGGVENYINNLCTDSSEFGIIMYWFGIYFNQKKTEIKESKNKKTIYYGDNIDSVNFIKNFCDDRNIDLIHVHSISNKNFMELLFEVRPIIRTMHEPRMICPGQGKFWRKSETICNKKFDSKCIYYAYKEGCCNRNPLSLFKSYQNTDYEISVASNKYKIIHVMSDFMREESINNGIDEKKIVTFPPYVKTDTNSTLIEFNKKKYKSILFVGRLSKTKGLHYAIYSVISVLDAGHEIRFDIVGTGHDESYFKSLVPEKYKSKIIFHGWKNKNEVNLFFSNCYLSIFPSIYPEAFGISGIESLMFSKPVIGFNVGGVSSWLFDNENGFLIDPKDIEKLTSKIIFLLKNKFIYEKFCKKSKKIFLSKFSVNGHFKKLKKIYSQHKISHK